MYVSLCMYACMSFNAYICTYVCFVCMYLHEYYILYVYCVQCAYVQWYTYICCTVISLLSLL